MYLLYADESGDTGHLPGSTPFFAISGLIVHELRWRDTLTAIVSFRKELRDRYGLKLREEIHAHQLVQKPKELARIPKSLRARLLRDVLDFESALRDVSVLNVIVNKTKKPYTYDVFDNAWRAFIQRFHNTIERRNFPGPCNPDERGMVIVDNTNEGKLRLLTRKMGAYNPVPSRYGNSTRQMPITTIIEDAVHRDSAHSYFVQLCDVNAYFLYQKHAPSSYIRDKGMRNMFNRLEPVLCKHASLTDPQGIVRL